MVLIVLPVYDVPTGWHNIFLDNYNISWSDGRSPAIFQFVKNGRLFLYGEEMSNAARIDFLENNNAYFPTFNTLPIIPFLLFSKLHLDDLNLYKLLIFSNILIMAATLIIFYFLQKRLGLKRTYAFLSSLIAGMASSLLIYTRYLFVQEAVYTLLFVLTIYCLVKKNVSFKKSCIIIAIIFFILYLQWFNNFGLYRLFNPIVFQPSSFQNYTPSYIYTVEGYNRTYDFFYSFDQPPGNAVFLLSNGMFQSLFGPRGFIFNSPFLIFAVFGLFIYKKESKKFLLFLILFFWFVFSVWIIWHGGWTPRYVRFFNIPILLLSFFSFYWLQEEKNKWLKLLFIGLVIISILNVISLTVRTDWTYELATQLVSNDWVVWPWV